MNDEATVSLAVPNEIVTTRWLKAPPALVWQAITDPAHVGQWWGPTGFRTTTRRHDLRVGGHWEHTMHGPDGQDWPNFLRYTAVRPHELLAWDHGTEEGGTPWFQASIRLEPETGGTRLTLHHVFESGAKRDEIIALSGAVEGAKQTTARLAAHLAAHLAAQRAR